MRLDQRHEPRPRRGKGKRGGERQRQADEAHIGDDGAHRRLDDLGAEAPRIGRLQHHDQGLGAELSVELSVADIDGEDLPSTAGDEYMGEAAGRGADIERDPAQRIEAEGVER